MSTKTKLSLPFIFAITLHLAIVAMFGYSYFIKDEVIEIKPPPEIIEATVLDEETVMAESKRLKTNEKNKKIAQNKKQQEIEDKRKKEEELFQDAKEKRKNEEKKAQDLEKRRNENELQEKKLEKQRKERAKEEKVKKAKAKKEKAEEAARQAKIKKQKEEKKRQDDLRKAEEKKRVAAQKAKKQKAAKQKAESEAEMDAEWDREQKAAIEEENRLATISFSVAITKKVNSKWIRPLTAIKGMSCFLNVKLSPSGNLDSVSIPISSGDDVFDRSAENAVRKAAPFSMPKNRDLNLREFEFEFVPE